MSAGRGRLDLIDCCICVAATITPGSGGSVERKALIPAALVFLGVNGALTGPAFAFQCPADMAKIDAALQTAELTDDQKAQVMELREEGEQQHASGNHQASVAALAEAKEILGIQ